MSQSGFSTYWRDYSLFEDEDDLALVVEDVPEVHDLAGVVADGEHGDLVQDVHGAVAQRAVGAGPDRASRPLSGKIPGKGKTSYLMRDENLAAYSRPVSLCVHLRTVAQSPLK